MLAIRLHVGGLDLPDVHCLDYLLFPGPHLKNRHCLIGLFLLGLLDIEWKYLLLSLITSHPHELFQNVN
jgi:hypothetical protein